MESRTLFVLGSNGNFYKYTASDGKFLFPLVADREAPSLVILECDSMAGSPPASNPDEVAGKPIAAFYPGEWKFFSQEEPRPHKIEPLVGRR